MPESLYIRIVPYCIKLTRSTAITKSMLCPNQSQNATWRNMPVVSIPVNDVPLIDAPRERSPRSIWSTVGLNRHGPAQCLYITPTNDLSHVTTATGLYYRSVLPEFIADIEWTIDSTDHYSVKLIFQAHLRMYSLTHTDSCVQPIADTYKQSCTTAQAAL
jgi:hypothetical protein